MKKSLLNTLLCATLLLGTVNNVSYTMEDNPVNKQVNNDIINDNGLSDINNLSAEIDCLDDNYELVKSRYSLAKKYFSQLNEIKDNVIKNQELQKIEDCLKICDECYVNIEGLETLQNDITNVLDTKYYNSKIYNNVLDITGYLESLIDILTYDINMYYRHLRSESARLKEWKSICFKSIDLDIKKLDYIVPLHKYFSEAYKRAEHLIKSIQEERNKLKELEQSRFEVKEQRNINQQQTANFVEHIIEDIFKELEFNKQRSIAIEESRKTLQEYNNMLSDNIKYMEELLNGINKIEKQILQIDMKKNIDESKNALLSFNKYYTKYSMMLKLYNTIKTEWKKNDYSNLIIQYRDKIIELNKAVGEFAVKLNEIASKETPEPRYK